MRLLDIIGTAIGNSFRSTLRTTLTVIAISIGAFTLTITSAIGTGVSDYISTQVAAIGADDVLTITKAADASAAASDGPAPYDPDKGTIVNGGLRPGPPGASLPLLSRSDLDQIAATGNVLSVEPSVRVSPDYIEYDGNGKFELGVNATAAITKADLAAGEQLSVTTDDNQILLPTSYLENLGFADAESAVGSTVTIGISDYLGVQSEVLATVVGVQNETLFGNGAGLNQALTDRLHAIQTSGRPGTATESFVLATATFDPELTPQQIERLKADLADQGFTAQTVADQLGAFQTVINGIIGVLNAFAVIALIAAGFGIINTLLMSVQERTREIGLMKAMGMSSGRIYTLFSAEAVFIGFLGSAVGALTAIGLGTVISSALADTLLADLPGLQIMQFAPCSIVSIIGVVMLIAFLAGTLPAARAARQNPIEALRYE